MKGLLCGILFVCAFFIFSANGTEYEVAVHTNLPWYIEFRIPLSNDFQPLALNGNLNSGRALAVPIGFSINGGDSSQRIFRNTEAHNFRTGDQLHLNLTYSRLGAAADVGEKKAHITFQHIINQRGQSGVIRGAGGVDIDPIIIEKLSLLIDDGPSTATAPKRTVTVPPLAAPEPAAAPAAPANTLAVLKPKAPFGEGSIDNIFDELIKFSPSSTTTTRRPTTTTRRVKHGNRTPTSTTAMPLKNTTAKLDEAVTCTPTASNEADQSCEKYMLETALEYGHFGSRLLLSGCIVPDSNHSAVDIVRDLIVDRLRLFHLSDSILQAQFIDEGVLFELSAARAVVEVLTQARLRLKKACIRVQPTERDFFDISQFERIN